MTSKLDTLTSEQKSVIHHLLKGHNVFLTGPGGVGKSYLISTIYNEFPRLKKDYDSHFSNYKTPKLARVQLTSMTGCSALLLGNKAKTLHSWASIGIGKGTVNELYVKIRKSSNGMRRWLYVDLLVIDEISMMTAELLDKLNQLAKKIRGNNKPFGGIQILLVADFHQLPPVCKNENKQSKIFAFESDCWNELIKCSIELTIIQRQKDKFFQKVLQEARIGQLSKESCELLESRQGLDWKDNKIRPTLLFPRRAEVDMINDANFRELSGKKYQYNAKLLYDGKVPQGFTENDERFIQLLQRFDSEAPYTKDLELMLNAQVMLVANVNRDEGLVNGSRGVVVGFCPASNLPIVEFINGITKTIGSHSWALEDYDFISRAQIPLKLAYALTIHKCQGASVDSSLVDIGSGIFEFGQAYVALSRCRSIEGLYVYDFNPNSFKVHTKVKEFYENLVRRELLEEDEKEWELISKHILKENEKPIYNEPSRPIQVVNIIKHSS
jgi:ATP-dependent DNA helicase PIF1